MEGLILKMIPMLSNTANVDVNSTEGATIWTWERTTNVIRNRTCHEGIIGHAHAVLSRSDALLI